MKGKTWAGKTTITTWEGVGDESFGMALAFFGGLGKLLGWLGLGSN